MLTLIKIEKTETSGWETAIRGMRNPLNSWDKSDSRYCDGYCDSQGCYDCAYYRDGGECAHPAPYPEDRAGYIIGPADLGLMKKLAASGNDHGKFLRMILVTADLTAPLYWWKEYDTYKVGTVANSCSTMHKIQAKEFTLADFSNEHLEEDNQMILGLVIEQLNAARRVFNTTQDKEEWWQMIQLLPSSYNQKRTVLLNYAVLKNIYHSRKNHKLDEWREFCRWIEGLPHSELITE